MDYNNVMISVIVLTYNAQWEKLSATLISIIFQNKIEPQIIIADDGSTNNFEKNILNLFKQYNFSNYKLSLQDENRGTVENIRSALQLCNGKYIKAISPGDCFYNNDSLFKWITFMDKNKSKISFGDAVFYNLHGNKIETINNVSSPFCKDVYRDNNRSELFVRYLLANDTILGASLAFDKRTLAYLLNKIKGKIIYAEDFTVRIAVFENIRIDYFDNYIIWYEYGTGISSSNNVKWNKRILDDFNSSNNIILNDEEVPDYLSEKYKKYLSTAKKLNIVSKIIKIIYFPSLINIRYEMRYKIKHRTNIGNANLNNNYFKQILIRTKESNASN